MTETIHLNGMGILAPGFNGWDDARSVLRGEEPYQADRQDSIHVSVIPAREKRRANKTSLIAVHVAEEAVRHANVPPDTLLPVFSSFGGDLQIADKLCTSIADEDPMLSAFQFHNSVHNAPAGYWSIGTHSTLSSTSIACGSASFHAALLEAVAMLAEKRNDVLLAVYDIETPHPLNTQHQADSKCGVAMVLSNTHTSQTIASFTVELSTNQNAAEPYRNKNQEINKLIRNNASMQALALLDPIANRISGKISFNFLNSMSINITLVKCH